MSNADARRRRALASFASIAAVFTIVGCSGGDGGPDPAPSR